LAGEGVLRFCRGGGLLLPNNPQARKKIYGSKKKLRIPLGDPKI
jgi:hypothetical protein